VTGVIDKPLLRLSDRVVPSETHVTGVKQAITHYDVLSTARHMSLVALRPWTGRTHQLRVHCASVLNCAIFGDARYSPDRLSAPVTRVIKDHALVSKLHLHARELCFKHPVTGQMLHLTADLPAHMRHTLTELNLAPDLTVASRAELNSEDFERVKLQSATCSKELVKKKKAAKKKGIKPL
jgi:23S rRNA pseudouridine955/2504/2580 synthase